MKLRSLSPIQVEAHLENGLALESGPFTFTVRGRYAVLRDSLHLLYADHPILSADSFVDFPVSLRAPNPLRRIFRPQVQFYFDQHRPFYPLPADQAFASFEWGLNWVISNHAHRFIILHAAVLERRGHALVLPGEPGAGKSTLCAALMMSGWRLFSDELTLIDPPSGNAFPLCRPVSLKNASIEVIRSCFADATLGPIVDATSKGRVTHVKPTEASVAKMDTPAPIAWIVFPRYEEGAPTRLNPRSKAESFLEVAKNAFNYSLHRQQGFEVMRRVVSGADCYHLSYSDLEEAMARLEALPLPEPVEPEIESLPR